MKERRLQMLYNVYVYFNRANDYVIYGIDEIQLGAFVEAYETGKESFFYHGETFKVNEEIKKIIVFDLSIVQGEINIYEIKNFIRKNLVFNIASFEGASTEFGVNVTSKFIVNPYGFRSKHLTEQSIVIKDEFVNLSRIDELKNCSNNKFDLTKLIRLCEELNIAYNQGLHFAVGTLVRALLDHIPPIFNQSNFAGVVNQYRAAGKEKSFKDSMENLEKSMRKIVDSILHSHITKSETLSNSTQIDCKRDLDRLLEEIVRILKK